MLARLSPALVLIGGSVFALAALGGALYTISRPYYAPITPDAAPPLEIYCAAAMVKVADTIGKEYETAYGQKVILHSGKSQELLVRMEASKEGDLFLPADESFIRLADKKSLVSDVKNVASMHAVLVVHPKVAKEIKTWSDFIALGSNIGVASPGAAISKLTKQELQGRGLWDSLETAKPIHVGDVNGIGDKLLLSSIDVGITWDALANVLVERKPDLKIVKLKELDSVKARVQIAVVKTTTQRDHALRFIAFLRAKDKGAVHLKKAGYSDVDEAEAMDDQRELTIYAGSMLRPGLQKALDEFEKREKVRITRVYNGCGLLVSQMQVSDVPDLYFACDTSFMDKVREKFEEPSNVTTNQLMIVVPKGNPKEILKLTDLGQKGLRVGVGHEHQCALGQLTQETFIRTGVFAKVVNNIVARSPTGDFLVAQLLAGSLDVVVAYRTNITPYPNRLDGIPITGVPCAAPAQPIAVAKSSKYPELSRRLMEYLQTEESKERFEKLGFGWDAKSVKN